MDRRNFLRTGSLAMLGSLAVPSLAMPASVRGALGGADNQSAVASAMAHFGVTEADLKKVMAAALEKGGDYADLYFEHTFNNSVVLMDGKVNNCGANIDFGMGVRVLPHLLLHLRPGHDPKLPGQGRRGSGWPARSR